MCFSASASFAAAAILAGTGSMTLVTVRRNRRWFFAALIPVFFSVQQLCEGIIWLDGGHSFLSVVCTYAFLFFAYLVWPVWIPLSVLSVEPDRARKKILSGLLCVGALLAGFLWSVLWYYPPQAYIQGCHVVYTHGGSLLVLGAYLLTVVGSLFVSSHKGLRLFGALVLASCCGAWCFYTVYFTSVWCFFAAIISSVLFCFLRYTL